MRSESSTSEQLADRFPCSSSDSARLRFAVLHSKVCYGLKILAPQLSIFFPLHSVC